MAVNFHKGRACTGTSQRLRSRVCIMNSDDLFGGKRTNSFGDKLTNPFYGVANCTELLKTVLKVPLSPDKLAALQDNMYNALGELHVRAEEKRLKDEKKRLKDEQTRREHEERTRRELEQIFDPSSFLKDDPDVVKATHNRAPTTPRSEPEPGTVAVVPLALDVYERRTDTKGTRSAIRRLKRAGWKKDPALLECWRLLTANKRALAAFKKLLKQKRSASA